jgi:hypothetical protein
MELLLGPGRSDAWGEAAHLSSSLVVVVACGSCLRQSREQGHGSRKMQQAAAAAAPEGGRLGTAVC